MSYTYNFITDHHDYNNNGYIGLVNLQLAGLPEKLSIANMVLTRKDEFHISIICARKIAELIDPEQIDMIEQALVEDFVEYQKEYPMTAFTLKHEYYLMRVDERVTIVGLVGMPAIEHYFEHLRQKYECELPTQPAHITLYTLDPAGQRGIGILSQTELTQHGEAVAPPELANVEVAS